MKKLIASTLFAAVAVIAAPAGKQAASTTPANDQAKTTSKPAAKAHKKHKSHKTTSTTTTAPVTK